MIIRYYVARNSANPRVRNLTTWCDRKDTSSKDGSMVPGLRRRPLIARDDLSLSFSFSVEREKRWREGESHPVGREAGTII